MWETLNNADGCGLAAPQINQPIKLFIVDSEASYYSMNQSNRNKYFENNCGIKETFINAQITEYSGDVWSVEEGCLSIPSLYESVKRYWQITIEYYNSQFQKQIQTFQGQTARIIQHEYDHTLGKLYIDHLDPFRKQMIRNKLRKLEKIR